MDPRFMGLVVSAVSLLSSCTPQPRPWRGASPEEWPSLRRTLELVRARPREPWAAGVRVTLREPISGRVVDGRGGIAVAPGRAIRMILIGAAGATILDAWVTRCRWRVAVPLLDLVRRGGIEEPGELPVGFLRWWLFTPLEGTMFAATQISPAETLLLLRDADAVIELRTGNDVIATRRVHGRTERVEEHPALMSPRAGDRVQYEDESNGLSVELVLESVSAVPPEEAFRDPDALGGAP